MKKHQLLSSVMLLTAAIIWGLAFVSQEQLADSMFDAMSPLIRKAYAAHEVGKG